MITLKLAEEVGLVANGLCESRARPKDLFAACDRRFACEAHNVVAVACPYIIGRRRAEPPYLVAIGEANLLAFFKI
jgi:hypothetical protein